MYYRHGSQRYLYIGQQFGDVNSTGQVFMSTRRHQSLTWRWSWRVPGRMEQVNIAVTQEVAVTCYWPSWLRFFVFCSLSLDDFKMGSSGSCPLAGFCTDGHEHPQSVTTVLVNNKYGCAIAQAVSPRLPTAAARVPAHARSCGIYGKQSGTDASFLWILRFSLPVLIPPTAPHSSSIIRGW
jgi:hypothetical protein